MFRWGVGRWGGVEVVEGDVDACESRGCDWLSDWDSWADRLNHRTNVINLDFQRTEELEETQAVYRPHPFVLLVGQQDLVQEFPGQSFLIPTLAYPNIDTKLAISPLRRSSKKTLCNLLDPPSLVSSRSDLDSS